MAIYGLNFNGTVIPPDASIRFAARLDSQHRAVGPDRGCSWLLQGVCETNYELERMIIQASNGTRRFHVVRRHGWIGVYCS